MILDGHIHITGNEKNRDEFITKLQETGVEGGIIMSLPPSSFPWLSKPYSAKERLENLFYWTGGNPLLYPFFWIDPLEADAAEQVETSVEYGIKGFKVICNRFFPGDQRPLEIFQKIARTGKPVLFHSGILWDGQPSSRYNRPVEFEALLDIKGLRFALAHVSWPWCDECIAVYGKFQNAHILRPDLTAEMFVDITPGTPPIYREDVLTKLHTVGYDISNHIIFGTDCIVNNFDCKSVLEWIRRDNDIYNRLGIGEEILEKVYSKNLKRFVMGS